MKKMKEPLYPPELIALAKNISCNFIDARITTKDYVGMVVESNNFEGKKLEPNHFVLSTCLRYEVYDCSNQQKHKEPFLYLKGITCVRRLLSVLVGLQSEILGEREILMQAVQSINNSHDEGYLDELTFQSLQQLILVSDKIRKDCGINSSENYSTIAADLFIDRLSKSNDITIAIVGGGYMADKFFSSLLKKVNYLKIKRIFWINRSTYKLENRVMELMDLLDFDIKVLDLEAGRYVLKEVDAIFCALSKSPYYYSKDDYKDGIFVVDVSYPQVFSENKKAKIITVPNTYFSSLIKEPISKNSVTLANKKIDDVVTFLENHI